MLKFYFFIISIILLLTNYSFSQKREKETNPIQFSGKVVTSNSEGDAIPLPYTRIQVKNTNRGGISDYEGYFSFVALKGETVVFSRVGFQTVEYTIPDTMKSAYYSWIQIMSEDNILLPEVVIFPWPSKEHFKQEFLAIDISNEMREHAEANLAENAINEIRFSVPSDGKEAGSIYMRQQAEEFKYVGQYKPQKIFDIMAWKRFIEAWKRGDFKKKKKE
jgi:hypothetical protein